ncbi:MAG: Fe(3+) ABC transporter substrate-binding protein, partial [Alphaproteobacteria bacterium HGW-Alphaproteobacteria-12]
MFRLLAAVLIAASGLAIAVGAKAETQEVNIYSARHYDTDLALYDRFTEETGIRVNLIEGESDELIARIEREGKYSPADILVTVD